MMSFRDGRLAKLALPVGTVWLLTDIAEAKGRQTLYVKQAPQLLKALRETALVQSVESSNRIEGVTVATGDYLLGDRDGVVVIPQAIVQEVVTRTEEIVATESDMRRALLGGMDPVEAYRKFGKF